jgi:hypothetical protein
MVAGKAPTQQIHTPGTVLAGASGVVRMNGGDGFSQHLQMYEETWQTVRRFFLVVTAAVLVHSLLAAAPVCL